MILNGELNYEEENKKLQLFLKKQEERIRKLKEKCSCKKTPKKDCDSEKKE
tara:strand:- start:1082 stop:1234 length:153 start_codon:yes stop_codon:yes gene_type:complete